MSWRRACGSCSAGSIPASSRPPRAPTSRIHGDLRRGDFQGSAKRLTALAGELRPGWLAFVGKEAYRGTFRERPELGEQERQLGETRLFVLPSTSPANAAVPYAERLRWFRTLRQSIG
jgi:TDG/mug DNA glycosylase family protein